MEVTGDCETCLVGDFGEHKGNVCQCSAVVLWLGSWICLPDALPLCLPPLSWLPWSASTTPAPGTHLNTHRPLPLGSSDLGPTHIRWRRGERKGKKRKATAKWKLSCEDKVKEIHHLDYTDSTDNSQFKNASTKAATLETYHELGSPRSSMLTDKRSSSLT